MYEITRIPLDRIHPNPFQTRSAIHKDHIDRLAASIYEQGLLQVPQAREKPRAPGQYQLVFGHSRLAAFQLLHQRHPDDERWARLPLIIVQLNDQLMFESCIAENASREDISPIARARALQTYIRMFDASQTEVGKLFGLSQGAVSNLIRLLSLPDQVIEIVDRRILSERLARALLEVTPAEAISIAVSATKHDEGHRASYVNERIRKIKARVRKEQLAAMPSAIEGDSDKPLLGPDACPHCWQVPRSYVRGREGWRCGACGGAVKVAVGLKLSTPT